MQRGTRIAQALVFRRQFIRPRTFRPLRLSHTLLHRNVTFTAATMAMSYGTIERGCLNAMDYRVFITNSDGVAISPWHDIPLYADAQAKIFNMVVEIPRWTNAKMEICKEENLNPIKQDVKKGKVRFVKNVFPHHGYVWNYGAFPQTWEDVDHAEPSTGTKGDNDPLDVCEIGQKVHARGSIIQVKVLGIMCLVDEGETDWKLLCIDITDPLADQLNDIEDVEKVMPGYIASTREWFKIYKMPDGKPPNQFAYDGEAKNKEFALRVIEETHEQWKRLVSGAEGCTRGDNCCKNLCCDETPGKVDAGQSKEFVEQSAAVGPKASLPEDVDKWHYVNLAQANL